jgi:hypothetical protein
MFDLQDWLRGGIWLRPGAGSAHGEPLFDRHFRKSPESGERSGGVTPRLLFLHDRVVPSAETPRASRLLKKTVRHRAGREARRSNPSELQGIALLFWIATAAVRPRDDDAKIFQQPS